MCSSDLHNFTMQYYIRGEISIFYQLFLIYIFHYYSNFDRERQGRILDIF